MTEYITKILHKQKAVLTSIVSVLIIIALAVGNPGGQGTLTVFAKTYVPAESSLLMEDYEGISRIAEIAERGEDFGVLAAAEKVVSIRHGQMIVGYLLTQSMMRQEQAARQFGEKEQREERLKETWPKILTDSEDYQTLLRIVEAEAGVCDSKGKILVANVVLNRVRSSEFPDTVREVVYQPSQFSPVSNGTINTCEVTDETVDCVGRALAGEDYSQGALYFMNRGASRSGSVRWFDGRLTYLFSHEGHEFFK